MAAQTPALMRCERCKAVISGAEATDMMRHGCGVCGGTLSLHPGARPPTSNAPAPSAEHRLLGVLREADGRPVGLHAITEAGIDDPANAIYHLEQAGHRIVREYAEPTAGRRRLLGYRLHAYGDQSGGGAQPSSSR